MSAASLKQPVSEKALLRRINRKLASEAWSPDKPRRLLVSRPNSRMENNMGRYYAVDGSNTVRDHHIDLEEWGREQGCLAEFEELVP